MAVLLVVTEHRSFLSAERVGEYERIRERLERVAAATVASAQYEDTTSLGSHEAIVLSGSNAPWSAHEPAALDRLGGHLLDYRGPVLGICAGMQLQAMFAGGAVGHAEEAPKTGFAPVDVLEGGSLLRDLPAQIHVYQHHADEITRLPTGFRVIARSSTCAVEAFADGERRWWGTQFHPEEFSPARPHGERVLQNFFELAGVT